MNSGSILFHTATDGFHRTLITLSAARFKRRARGPGRLVPPMCKSARLTCCRGRGPVWVDTYYAVSVFFRERLNWVELFRWAPTPKGGQCLLHLWKHQVTFKGRHWCSPLLCGVTWTTVSSCHPLPVNLWIIVPVFSTFCFLPVVFKSFTSEMASVDLLWSGRKKSIYSPVQPT